MSQAQVAEFHLAFGHPVASCPTLIQASETLRRAKWMQEEICEFLDASIKRDLGGIADALADLLYFVFGTAVVHGIPLETCFDIVHKANMNKLGADGKPIIDPKTGKVIKGPNWKDPTKDIMALLQERIDDWKYDAEIRESASSDASGLVAESPEGSMGVSSPSDSRTTS